ncbi:ABC transporter permease [Naasia aerilata]|uniref:Permease n=1 Tax=Naasia aerilata TaxID=1162966 RepID=A0ABM8GGW6_9MICO|nr:ABC transporter permease [Naasia aerilata]BDZ47595.1 permease [Naasia aerilata]
MNGLPSRFLTGLVGAVSEAWSELRVHRGRVLLSLIGVGVAVCALTGVVAAGSIAEQALRESSERSGGRAATMSVSAYNPSGAQIPVADVRAAFQEAVRRYDITYSSEHGYSQQQIRFPDGRRLVSVETVEVPFGQMHRVETIHGAWFTDADERRLAPALVVNQRFWELIGSPDLRTHPTVALTGSATDVTALVVGVTPSSSFETEPTSFLLASQALALLGPADQEMYGTPQFEVWVPPAISQELGQRLSADISGQLGDDVQVDVYRNDYAEQNAESLRQVQLLVGGIALLVLLLGALGLVNIALVTVRARIREIGIRRTFGATAGRVFFAVMMESVVATVAAGVVGVMLAILLIRNPITTGYIAQGVTDVPPFPMEAALLGLVAASAVGALAGLVPALVAVRVKVIDAIRY